MSKSGKATFTGQRLDWCKAVRFDPRLLAVDFKVATTISDHVNEKSGIARVSDAIIAIKAACSISTVIRSRERLRDAGWLDWRRTARESGYRLCFEKVSRVLDMITGSVEAHREAERKHSDLSRLTEHSATCSVIQRNSDLSLMTDIHPQGTPSEKRVGKGRL